MEQQAYCGERIHSGWLVSEGGAHRYAIRDFIPRFVPESNYANNVDMQWNLLFDMLSPEFDNPQTPETVTRWLHETGLAQIEVFKARHLVGRGRVPYASRH